MNKLLFFCLALTMPFLSYSQWQPMNGPCGGTLRCFLQKDTYIFAATETHGVFRSENAGSSWTSKNNGLANQSIRGLAATNTGIFAATQGGLFSSPDNGDHWETVIINGMAGIECLSVVANGNTVIVTTIDGNAMRSADSGNTWETVIGAFPGRMYATMNGTEVYIGTEMTTVFYSADDGLTYNQMDNCPFFGSFSFAFKGTKIFTAAMLTSVLGSAVFVSANHGETWSMLGNSVALVPGQVAVNGNQLYASSLKDPLSYQGPGGLYVSSDDGLHWASAGLSDYSILPMTFSGSRVIAGAWPGGVFISEDGGGHWVDSGKGLEELPIQSIIRTGSLLYTVSGSEGILTSDDDGQNWRHVRSGLPENPGPMIVQSTTLIAGSANQVFYSEDNGASWSSKINTGYPIVCFQVKGNSLFAGTTGGGIFVTDDHGISWHSVNSGLNSTAIQAFAVKGSAIYVGTANGLYKSTDDGETWTPSNHGLTSTNIRSLAANSSRLFTAVTESQYSVIYRSENEGITWERSGQEFEYFGYSISMVTDEQHIIAGVGSMPQVVFSDDNGLHWSVVNTGLPSNRWTQSLYISGTTLYATTSEAYSYENKGLWKRALSELFAFSIEPDTVFLTSGEGNSGNLNITSTTPWTLEGTMPGWLTANLQGGEGTGMLTFSALQANSYLVPRYADLDIASLGTLRHVVVAQHEKVNSVNEMEISGIALYPNPSKGLFLLKADFPVNKVTVFNAGGRVVVEVPVNGNSAPIDLSGNQKGVYSILVNGNSGHSIRRVVVL